MNKQQAIDIILGDDEACCNFRDILQEKYNIKYLSLCLRKLQQASTREDKISVLFEYLTEKEIINFAHEWQLRSFK